MNSMAKQATDRLQQALEKAKKFGASAARFNFSQSQSIGCGFENGRLRKSQSQRNIGLTIDLIAGGRRGQTDCNNLADLDEMIGRTVALARAGSAVHFDAYPPPGPITKVPTWSPKTAVLPRTSLIDNCQRIVDAVKQCDADACTEASGYRGESESVVVTSGGVCHEGRGTVWTLRASTQRTRGTDMLESGFGRNGRDLNDLYSPDEIIRQMIFDLEHSRRIVPIPSGKTTVLLSPEQFGDFLDAILMGVDGRQVFKGESPLKGRIGQQVLDPCLTLIDDPHLPYHVDSAEISAEGIPTRPMTLFDRGVLQGFLYDFDTAGMAGAVPTGHNNCRCWSLDVAPGAQTSGQLLASIDQGLLVKDLLGFGQGNLVNGDFSCNVALGMRIEKGEVTGRVKNVMIAGNIYELLKANVRLSSDKDPILRRPHVALEGVQVSAAGQ